MGWETEKPFDLEKIRLEELDKLTSRALEQFEGNPRMCWTQLPMEKPLWETLQSIVRKEIPTNHIEDSHETVNGGFIGEVPIFKCGKCEKEVCYGVSYCCHCGQKLEWGD